MSKVIVVGGGPAGMFAAIAAAERGHEVVLLEKNEKLGEKALYHRQRAVQHHERGGYGHPVCQCDDEPEVFVQCFYDYDNQRVIDFF